MINDNLYYNSKNLINLSQVRKFYNFYKPNIRNQDLEKYLREHGFINDTFDFNCANIRELTNNIIWEYYPNENVIKSAFIEQIIMKSKKHTTIFELPVNGSRVDLCKITSTSTSYEIKTEFDNYSRLDKQLEDYLYVFEQVYVICPLQNVQQILDIIPLECGVYSYEKKSNYSFVKVRTAQKSILLSPQKQLNMMTKKELNTQFNIPYANTREELTEKIIQKYSSKYINSMFKKAIKNRYNENWNFLEEHYNQIYKLDYQWFFKNNINPELIYY